MSRFYIDVHGEPPHYCLEFMGRVASLLGKGLGQYGQAKHPRLRDFLAGGGEGRPSDRFQALFDQNFVEPQRLLAFNYFDYLVANPQLTAGFRVWRQPDLGHPIEVDEFRRHLLTDWPVYLNVLLLETAGGEGVLRPILPADYLENDHQNVFSGVNRAQRIFLRHVAPRVNVGYIGQRFARFSATARGAARDGFVCSDIEDEGDSREASETPLEFDLYLGYRSQWLIPLWDLEVAGVSDDGNQDSPLGVLLIYSPVRGLARILSEVLSEPAGGQHSLQDQVSLFVRRHQRALELRRSNLERSLWRPVSWPEARLERAAAEEVATNLLRSTSGLLAVQVWKEDCTENRITVLRSGAVWQSLETTLEMMEYVGVPHGQNGQIGGVPPPASTGLAGLTGNMGFDRAAMLHRLHLLNEVLGLEHPKQVRVGDLSAACWWESGPNAEATADGRDDAPARGSIEDLLRAFDEIRSKQPAFPHVPFLIDFLKHGQCEACEPSSRNCETGLCPRFTGPYPEELTEVLLDPYQEVGRPYHDITRSGWKCIVVFSPTTRAPVPDYVIRRWVDRLRSTGSDRLTVPGLLRLLLSWKAPSRKVPSLSPTSNGAGGSVVMHFEGLLRPGASRGDNGNGDAAPSEILLSRRWITAGEIKGILYLHPHYEALTQPLGSGWQIAVFTQDGVSQSQRELLKHRLAGLADNIKQRQKSGEIGQVNKNIAHSLRAVWRPVISSVAQLESDQVIKEKHRAQLEKIRNIATYSNEVISLLNLVRELGYRTQSKSVERDQQSQLRWLSREENVTAIVSEQAEIAREMAFEDPELFNIPRSHLDGLVLDTTGITDVGRAVIPSSLLRLALTDLILNAYRHSGSRGRIRIWLVRTNDRIQLTVSNPGAMPQEVREAIWHGGYLDPGQLGLRLAVAACGITGSRWLLPEPVVDDVTPLTTITLSVQVT